jgi:hypothetical protein
MLNPQVTMVVSKLSRGLITWMIWGFITNVYIGHKPHETRIEELKSTFFKMMMLGLYFPVFPHLKHAVI